MKSKDKLFFFIQSLLKYKSSALGLFCRKHTYKFFFKHAGKNIRIRDGVTIKYPSDIEIGDNCYIGEGCYLVGKGGLKIGNNFLMGAGSKVITSNHNFDDLDVPINQQGLTFNEIEIGDNVWLGFDVKVFGGSTIGNDSIVGANSLVNKKFLEKGAVLVGIPAKVIKVRKLDK